MATLNGLTDVVATVMVPKPEYEDLIRESNTLRIIENYISTETFPSINTVKCLLGLETESEDK